MQNSILILILAVLTACASDVPSNGVLEQVHSPLVEVVDSAIVILDDDEIDSLRSLKAGAANQPVNVEKEWITLVSEACGISIQMPKGIDKTVKEAELSGRLKAQNYLYQSSFKGDGSSYSTICYAFSEGAPLMQASDVLFEAAIETMVPHGGNIVLHEDIEQGGVKGKAYKYHIGGLLFGYGELFVKDNYMIHLVATRVADVDFAEVDLKMYFSSLTFIDSAP